MEETINSTGPSKSLSSTTKPVLSKLADHNTINASVNSLQMSSSLHPNLTRTAHESLTHNRDHGIHPHIFAASFLHDDAFVSAWRLRRILRTFDFSNHELKCLGHVLIEASACFSPSTLELFCQCLAMLLFNLSLFWAKVTFVSHDDHGYCICTLAITSMDARSSGL